MNEETRFGISAYLNENWRPIHCLVKNRYADFMVHEMISRDMLSTSEAPHGDGDGGTLPATITLSLTSTAPVTAEVTSQCPSDSLSHTPPLISDEVLASLQELNDCGKPGTERAIRIPVGCEKSERSEVHKFIKAKFTKLISSTVTSASSPDDRNLRDILVSRSNSALKAQHDPRSSQSSRWPKSRPDYLQFVMCKRNVDTMQALRSIASITRINQKRLSFAGTKDKRAITTQLVHAYRLCEIDLLRVNKLCRGISVGNCRYVADPLNLGDHNGNHFSVVLRCLRYDSVQQLRPEDTNTNVSELRDSLTGDVTERLHVLRKRGFVNFFGPQRFGTAAVNTADVGKLILKQDYKSAVLLILAPQVNSGDIQALHDAKEIFAKTHDPQKALLTLGKYHCIESDLWRCEAAFRAAKLLPSSPGCPNDSGPTESRLFGIDWQCLFMRIPRSMRLLYLHAYQSFLWNKIASRRVASHGASVLIGDLFRSRPTLEEDVPNVSTTVNIDTVRICDVVLPVPGCDVVQPKNEYTSILEDLLAKDGLSMAQFDHPNKDCRLSGAYRSLLASATDLQFEFVPYADCTVPLFSLDTGICAENHLNDTRESLSSTGTKRKCSSDIEGDTKRHHAANNINEGAVGVSGEQPHGSTTGDQGQRSKDVTGDEIELPFVALKLQFSLPKSAYATVLLREAFHFNTSYQVQSKLKHPSP